MTPAVRLLVVMTVLLALASAAFAAPGRQSLLEEMGIPVYPDGKLSTEIVLPAGPLLDKIAEEFADLLGMSSLKQVGIVSYVIKSSTETSDVLKYYAPFTEKAGWTTLVSTIEKSGNATAILINDAQGMLVMNIDAPGAQDRQITFVRATGTVDRSKLRNLDGGAAKVGKLMSDSLNPGIPAGQPISVPPSDKVNIQSTKSEIVARLSGQNTVEINPAFGTTEIGDLSRTDDGRLLLSLAPKVSIEEMTLPGNVPIVIELTEGSLTLSGGPGSDEKPSRLTVLSTGAPVTLKAIPLVSGSHRVKVVGKSAEVTLSQVEGGSLEIDVQGGDATLILPNTASATLSISAPAGKINNLTSVQPTSAQGDSMTLKLGDGKASISIKAIDGIVWIRLAS